MKIFGLGLPEIIVVLGLIAIIVCIVLVFRNIKEKNSEQKEKKTIKPVASQNVRIALLILSGVCLLLLFTPWITSDALGSISAASEEYLGTSFSYTFLIPSMLFKIYSLCSDGAFSSSDTGLLMTVAFVYFAIWLWALIDIAYSLYKVITNKSDAYYLKRSIWIAFCAAAAVIVFSFLINSAVSSSMDEMSYGLSSALFSSYLSATGWVWLTLIVAVAELITIKASQSSTAVEKASKITNSAVKAVSDGSAKLIKDKETKKLTCPKCGKEITMEQIFCSQCGVNIIEARKEIEKSKPQIKTCPVCNAQTKLEAKFCPKCGYQWREEGK